MAKGKGTAFFCKECGYETTKWFGQCPACKEWNTLVEEPVSKGKNVKGIVNIDARVSGNAQKPVKLSEISMESSDRTTTSMKELDRVLGGGIVAGSLVLVG
ncbi:MAG: DNA repair protein RadA, partial [Lachnospira sp.]|nr:DNA repair protein RadA [Lachnospira sp.]